VSREVQWTHRALRAVSRLDRPTRERIARGIESFAALGQGDVKRLKGKLDGLFRLRVGDWRVFFSEEDDRILDRAVRPRGDAC
jgi:mRNA interferase RelE/StbE